MRTLYEIAHYNRTTVGELTGTRRKWSVIHLPDGIAEFFGLNEDERTIRVEHFDDGISANEIPFISALWDIKDKEAEKSK